MVAGKKKKGTAVASCPAIAENALEFPYHPRTKEKLEPAVATEARVGSASER